MVISNKYQRKWILNNSEKHKFNKYKWITENAQHWRDYMRKYMMEYRTNGGRGRRKRNIKTFDPTTPPFKIEYKTIVINF